ncbi:hypothetical protein KL86DPRO_70088 [uncultured delta proteobacterium]|uniref:Uncharacterized protein n=1 Tax=uncultured delta proteobacterium TaxID=34034 RepID=A0A212KGT5_9DELT|nr:hypothetical protein KL86DPRO_70088 [uncultured delta proteobacterium]
MAWRYALGIVPRWMQPLQNFNMKHPHSKRSWHFRQMFQTRITWSVFAVPPWRRSVICIF